MQNKNANISAERNFVPSASSSYSVSFIHSESQQRSDLLNYALQNSQASHTNRNQDDAIKEKLKLGMVANEKIPIVNLSCCKVLKILWSVFCGFERLLQLGVSSVYLHAENQLWTIPLANFYQMNNGLKKHAFSLKYDFKKL